MTHISEIFTPIYLFSKITGFSPFTMKNRKISFRSRRNIVQIVFFSVIFLYCIFLLFEKKMYAVPSGEEIGTIIFVLAFRLTNSVANVLLTTFVLFLKSKKFLLLFKKIEALDEQFITLNLEQYIKKSNKSVKKTILLLYIFFQFVVNIFCFGVSLFTKLTTNPRHFLVAFGATVFPRLIATNMNLSFCSVILILKERLKTINAVLWKKVRISRLSFDYPNDKKFPAEINNLCFLHKKIIEVSKDINSTFYVHLLLWVSVSFLLFIGDLYLIVHFTFFNPYADFSTIFAAGKSLIIYITDIALLVKCASDICQEANCTKKILVAIKINIHKEEAQDSVSILKEIFIKCNLFL